MITLTPGILYKCINTSLDEGPPHFGSPCEYMLDNNRHMIHNNSLRLNDIIMFVESIWVPNVTLHKFIFKDKTILLSSYFDKWYNDVLVEFK